MTLVLRPALAALFVFGLAAAAAAAPSVYKNPDWLQKPTQADLLAVIPTKAAKAGKNGKAQIGCIVTVQGTLRACKIEMEEPADYGFGAAAIALTPQFTFRPATRDGSPMESQISMPINFIVPSGSTQGTHRNISGIPWLEAPSVADMEAAYPPRARAKAEGGSATLDCVIAKSGRLFNCSTLRQSPGGFGEAARDVVGKFRSPTDDGKGGSLVGAHTQILITFAKESLTETRPAIGKPQWAELPSADDLAGVVAKAPPGRETLDARVILDCRIEPGGALSACTVASETYADLGLGPHVLALSDKFRLGLWTAEGLPTVGGRVRVPLRFKLNATLPAQAAPGF